MSFRVLGEPFKTLGGLGGVLGGAAGGSVVQFLFRDDFVTTEAAPIATPRTAEPGPGIETISDVENMISIASGEMVVGKQVTPAWGDEGFYCDAISRGSGIVLIWLINMAQSSDAGLGWNNAQDIPVWNGMDNAFRTGLGAGAFPVAVGATSISVGTVVLATDYIFALILRSSGCFYAVKGGIYAEWTLLWVDDLQSTATLYPTATAHSADFNLDSVRASQLAAPWDDDFGIATDRLAGARLVGDTFIHIADCLIEFIVSTRPVALQIEMRFRIQDASNYWQVTIDSAGDLDLDEVVATVVTQRGTAAGVIINNDRVVIVAEDETIRVYEANTLRITYALAANFKGNTDGELETEGTAGSVSDIVSWPRLITGEPAAALDRVVNA